MGELGKNMFALQSGSEILLIDGGLAYAPTAMLGVEFLVPAADWLIENRQNIVGWILTHAHEDHIGGLPYLLRYLPRIPVFATKLTLAFLERDLADAGMGSSTADLREVAIDGRIELGEHFIVDFLRMTHSVPDNVGLVIHTPVGRIVYTGDFKLEHHPQDGHTSHLHALALAGQEGVLALLSDSTNAERPGYTPSERTVREGVQQIVEGAQGRVFITTSSTNFHRIQSLIHIAEACHRRIIVEGGAMLRGIKIAQAAGYLEAREPLLTLDEATQLTDQEVCVICTGAQGQPEEVLSQLVAATPSPLSAKAGDTVVMSAQPLPINIEDVYRLLDQLASRSVDIYYPPYHPVHASGHASQEELKLMLDLMRPKFFLPVHGEMRHQANHLALAQSMARPPERCVIPQNGEILEFTPTSLRHAGSIKADVIYVDRHGADGELSEVVVRDRQALAQQGILAVMVVLASKPKIEVMTLGGLTLSRKLELDIIEIVRNSLGSEGSRKRDLNTVRNDIYYPLRRYMRKQTGREPLIIPTLLKA